MQERDDHGVRGYCTRHKQVIVDECDDCADEEERMRTDEQN